MATLKCWIKVLFLIGYSNIIVSCTPVCVYKGTFYIPDTEIYDGGCNVAYCDKMAQLIFRDGCSTSTGRYISPPVQKRVEPTTFPFFTTTMFGCNVGGKIYPPNSDISKGEAHSSNWCYGTYCDSNGQTVFWDNFNCYPTTSPPTTTTIPQTTVPTNLSTLLSAKGCFYNGKFYLANTNLGAPDDRATKYCTKCDENGQIQHWYDFDCFRTDPTPPGSTLPIVG